MAQNDFTAFDVSQTGSPSSAGDRAASSSSNLQVEDNSVSNSIFLKAFDTSIKVVDEGIRYDAIEESRKAVEAEQASIRQAEFSTTLRQADQSQGAPPEVAAKLRDMDRAQAAVDAGKLDRTAYFSRLDAAARQLRSRYPGYRDEIDQAISRFSGVKPANAVVDSIFDRFEQATKNNPEGKERDYYMKQASQLGLTAPFIMEQNGAMMPTKDLRILVTEANARDIQRKRQIENLDTTVKMTNLGEKRNDIVTKEVDSIVSREAQRFQDKAYDNMFSATSQSDLSKMIRESEQMREQGIAVTPQMQAKFDLAANSIRKQAEQDFNSLMSTKLGDGRTVAQSLGSVTEVQKRREAFMNGIKPLVDNISTNNLSAVASNANSIKAAKEYGEAGIRLNDQAFNKQAAFRDAMGETVLVEAMKSIESKKGVSYWQTSTQNWMGKIAMTDVVTASNVSQVPSVNDALRKATSMQLDGHLMGGYTKGLLQKHIDVMSNEKLPSNVRLNALEGMFGQKNSNFMVDINQAQRVEALSFMTTPEVTKEVKKLEEKTPGSFKKYQDWVARNAMVAISKDVSELNSLTTADIAQKKVTFKETTGQVEVVLNPVFVGNRPGYKDIRDQKTMSAENINKVITLYGHIIGNKPEQIREFLIGAGLSVARPIEVPKTPGSN